MKLRFSSLDLQVIAHELSATITNYRLSNIYDITSRIFLLKFAKPESKHLLLIDSGFRCHLTVFSRGTASKQSSFVTRLRKCLRTRRCTKVQQIGTDRVLEFEFSTGEYRLYLEFYAGGNVILVNKEGVIIAVLRDVKGGEGGVGGCKVGAKYEVSKTVNGVLRERVTEALKASLGDDDAAPPEVTGVAHQGASKKYNKKKKKKKKGEDAVNKILSSRMSEFPPTLIEHCFLMTGVDPEIKAEEVLADDEKLNAIIVAFEKAEEMIKEIMADVNGAGIKGYIIAKAPRAHVEQQAGGSKKDKKHKKGVSFGADDAVGSVGSTPKPVSFGTTEAIESELPEKIQEEGEAKGMVYDDFFPFLPSQYLHAPGIKAIERAGYNHTVDTFFSSIESQKSETRISTMKENAAKRLDAARTDHAKRVEGLRTLQEINTAKAQAIEVNLDRVEEVITSVNGLIAQGMDWAAMGQLVEIEKKRGNTVAELIKLPLKLSENTVTITLAEPNFEEESDDDESADETDPDDSEDEDEPTHPKAKKPAQTLDIDIDLGLTGYANASSYFTQKKVLLVKESKTIQSSTKALKSTENKIQVDLKKALKQEKDILRPVRNQVWFEKFLFFISSDGYLVLGGRDLQQNEILYRRYFKRGDVYVSTDVEGAAMVIIKNNPGTPNAPIPPSTLSQAGTLSVATSKAWDSKSVMSAWWVTYEQVGKTMGGGRYLDAGMFDIKGKKNFLPPAQLILGYGILWYVDDESRKRHGKHRFDEGAVEATVAQEEETEIKSEKEEEEDEGEEDESDDEEFPDAQIESAGEEAEDKESEGGVERAEESEDGEFPDAEVKEKDSEPEGESAAPEADEEKGNTDSPAPDRINTPTGSKHMSTKERSELRKARAAGREPPTNKPTLISEDSANKGKPAPPKPEPQPATVRGKKGKQKKLASKYAYQDEEDRAVAMELLGSTTARAKAEDAAAVKAAKEAELAFQKARRKEQHARAAREGLKAEEARRRENPDEGEEDDITTKIPLDSFIGTPIQGDNLLEAIPVCAPWGAMGKFKYKTKMQPGSVKKGKAVKDVVARWLTEGGKKMDMKSVDTEKMWPRENELIKGWKEAEIINCVGVSKVKVFGGSAAATGGKGGSGKRGGRGSKKK